MNPLESGYERAIAEISGGFVSAFIITFLVNSGLVAPSWLLLFNLVNGVGALALFSALRFWALAYLIGWLIGMGVMLQSGLMDWLDVLSFFVVPFFYLIYKLAE